uniref:Ribosomal protein L36 n=1 Tax=Berchemiella wilsonii TaxID=325278 RepID=A0A4Y5WYD9_9ROSA|nr:ribosomal protein L36 [Berchemiella wilsonii]QDE13034.1 ribosomal protein L36 [Berchemiella wilsonii]
MSLFMSRIGTNYYNSSSPTDQSAFFTNFTHGGSYFHICHSLT